MKTCDKCNINKSIEEFELGRRTCKKCRYRSHTQKRQERFQTRRNSGLCYYCGIGEPSNNTGLCESCYERFSYPATKVKYDYASFYKKYHKKLRNTCLDHYGHECACCGETIDQFLTFDHINNDGAKHRKEVGKGNYLYRWLIDNKFPNTFQVLCFNCNSGRQVNGGVCPHND